MSSDSTNIWVDMYDACMSLVLLGSVEVGLSWFVEVAAAIGIILDEEYLLLFVRGRCLVVAYIPGRGMLY